LPRSDAVRAGKFEDPGHHFLVMPAEITRSNETSCPARQAGRLPYFLLHTYG